MLMKGVVMLLALLHASRSLRSAHPLYSRCDSFLRLASEKNTQQQAVADLRATATAALLIPLLLPLGSRAGAAVKAKGAFEMDMEYYLGNIVSGNKGDNRKRLSKGVNFYPSARHMDEGITKDVITEVVARSMIQLSNGSISTEYIQRNMTADMPKALDFFRPFVPISAESFSDQYFTDIYLFVLYKIAQDFLPKSEQRVMLRRAVGDGILSLLEKRGRLTLAPAAAALDDESRLMAFAASLKTLLVSMVDIGFIASFIYDEDDLLDSTLEPLQQGYSLPCQITLVRPVNMLSFLYYEKNDLLFHPDVVTNVIASLTGRYFDVSYDDYLLDNFYRESNYDVQAQDSIVELSITKKKAV